MRDLYIGDYIGRDGVVCKTYYENCSEVMRKGQKCGVEKRRLETNRNCKVKQLFHYFPVIFQIVRFPGSRMPSNMLGLIQCNEKDNFELFIRARLEKKVIERHMQHIYNF